MKRGRVIAIDGPAASGKSTTAREVARRLGYWHVNSGLLYRAITHTAIEHGWRETDPAFGQRVAELDLAIAGTRDAVRVRVGGRELGAELRSSEVTARVSAVAAVGAVRNRVLDLLREAAVGRNLVVDGRDIGTVVFPDAELKVFLTASPEERARRRLREFGREPTGEQLIAETRRLQERDRADASRALAPLRRAPDAVELDTTDLRPNEVVDRIVSLAENRGLTPEDGPVTGTGGEPESVDEAQPET